MNMTRPKRSAPRVLSVTRSTRITPNMIRLTLCSPDLADIPPGCAGGHCKIMLPEPGQNRAEFARQLADGPRPVMRTYTVRFARPELGEIDVDFVAHGSEGVASAWAEAARPGDFCGFGGPGDPKLVDFDADWYLIAADMSALPVAAAALEALPRDAKGLAVFEITAPEDKQQIDAPPGMVQRWLVHDHPHRDSTAQIDLLRALDWPTGRVRTMMAGETGAIQALRALARSERGVDRKACYASGYWRIGLREDEHQKIKRDEAQAEERALKGN